MNPFRVWIRPLESNCRIRVDGVENTRWLLDRMGRSFVFKTAAPVDEETGSSCCAFRVAYSSHINLRGLARVLAAIPEVRLTVDPA